MRRRIHDFRGIHSELGSEEVLDLAQAAVELWRSAPAPQDEPAPRVAILAHRDLGFGLARMFESYAESIADGRGIARPELCVVRSFPEAADWVGLPQGFRDPFEPGPQPVFEQK